MFAEKGSSFFKKIGEAFRFKKEDGAEEGGQERQEVGREKQIILEVKRIIGSTNERAGIEQAGETARKISEYLKDVLDVPDEGDRSQNVVSILNLFTFELKIPSKDLNCKFTVKAVSEFVSGGEKKGYYLTCDKKFSDLFQDYIDLPGVKDSKK